MKIDLNADLGESFGAYQIGSDEELLKVVSSANIACGFHAGDFQTIPHTIQTAKEMGVAIGAHPGFPDIQGFGRRRMDFSHKEIYNLVMYQLGAFKAFAQSNKTDIQHVKPHGALYNLANKDQEVAEAIAKAVYDFDPTLILFGLCNSFLVEAGQEIGLNTVQEAFADRTYTDEGLLMPRTEPNAMKHETDDIIKQVLMIVNDNIVISNTGKTVEMEADTICLHGDTPSALEHAKEIKAALDQQGIQISSFNKGR
ncbi:LamB/YcsF family protein [Filobacillus milosensis]|uniref:5-oxoprolinase subunit A n=1 Tax=Filobacillus milosensis TaxID=94137 RepID=A0A4Y8IIK5_9BACI|nr:5-oxoprolinase subunit PxpA [Filobacillus milosensis]TFB15075.1 LamB/YcsF family protein [Filobacillus milosensis]